MQLLTAGELLQLLLQRDGGVVGAKYLRSQAVHQLLQVLIENRSLQERRRGKTTATKNVNSLPSLNLCSLIFAYSYVQSVKEVVPRLLVLQEQLEVFEDLRQN